MLPTFRVLLDAALVHHIATDHLTSHCHVSESLSTRAVLYLAPAALAGP